MKNLEKKQEAVRQFWNQKPCDSEVSAKNRSIKDYYEEIQQDRYRHQDHVREILDWVQWRDKKILEIGTGVGTDARNTIRHGALYHGINVDKGSVEATQIKRLIFSPWMET